MATFTINAIQILKNLYLLKDTNGQQNFSLLLKKKVRIYGKFDFMPNAPNLMQAFKKASLVPVLFCRLRIALKLFFSTLMNAALIHQRGGGTSFNFSKLPPPKVNRTTTSGGTSSGPVVTDGKIIRHEGVDIIEEIGKVVTNLKKGITF